ncbi:hypothetical protein B0H14DRAFT_3520007 [Mycena olivaceomarginata]|nr:hypothetical protein B0H14DRAFT_3520007 [Mycena olivaceomarginata]
MSPRRAQTPNTTGVVDHESKVTFARLITGLHFDLEKASSTPDTTDHESKVTFARLITGLHFDSKGELNPRHHCVSDHDFDIDGTLPYRLTEWLTIIGLCTPSDSVLNALENLDVTQFCARIHSDPEYHRNFHEYYLRRDSLQSIRFPYPPQQTIEFWERQLAAMETCRRSLIQDEQSGSEDSKDEDGSDEEEF